MSKQPFMPLFFGDFLAATTEWDGEEQALYLLLLAYQWSQGSLPADADRLCRVVRWSAEAFNRCWPTVRGKFVERDGRLYNARLEQHRAKTTALSEKNADAGRKGAAVKWRKDGERHPSANGDAMANAINPPSVFYGNPSHPIPSHPNPSHPSTAEPDGSVHAKAPKPKGAKRCPADFVVPAEAAAALAAELPADFDLDAETAKFRDWEFAKARTDWLACWRTWLRKARDDRRYARRTVAAQTAADKPALTLPDGRANPAAGWV